MILPVTEFMVYTHMEQYGILSELLTAIIHKSLLLNYFKILL